MFMESNELIPTSLKEKYWLVAADMGYGHQRAIYPLKALGKSSAILNANTSPGSTLNERRKWKELLRIYEYMSRAGRIPFAGSFIARILDKMLYIPNYYPIKDMSDATLQVRYVKLSIKNGLCKGILEHVKSPALPMITSFYASALAAGMTGNKPVYCIICDTDLSRVWVAEDPSKSVIEYFASGTVSAQRLISYGVLLKNIHVTGFPLPLELLGDRSLNTLRSNLDHRLKNLDPHRVFSFLYKHSINAFLRPDKPESYVSPDEPRKRSFTITFAIGGAGAQKEIGKQIVHSLANEITDGFVKINLVAGTRIEVRDYFLKVKAEIKGNNENVRVIWEKDNEAYFVSFNECLHSTDILWTKPSELSFYCALGIPIIMTPAIGPQEKCNQRWLREIGAGFKQRSPEDTNEWLFDLINKGRLAEAAWNGFLKGRKYGTYNIIDYLETGTFSMSNDPLLR
jgi:hypothetical protein